MTSIKNIASAIACFGLLAGAAVTHASPVQFDITSATRTIGTGYGQESATVEASSATLLDVRFTDTFSTQNATLFVVGESWSFDLGTVDFRELNSGGGTGQRITAGETDNLEVSWLFSFANPLTAGPALVATVTADIGQINDNLVDYSLAWSDTLVNFNSGGLFSIHLNNLSFTNSGLGAQTQTATVTLLGLPGATPDNAQAIPEPASLALVGLALAGLATLRRRKG